MKKLATEATVVITTKNRRDDLRKAVASALEQTARVEVLVIDDGSTDGSSEMIRTEFPQAILHRFEKSEGLIVQRNRGARLARSAVVLSMDDDAVFSSPDTLAATLREFDHARVGAVAIPVVHVNSSPAVQQLAPDDKDIYLTDSYIGTAHALRRDLFLALGGYREFLFHQGEESDYCIRMLAAGRVVRLGRADPILHFESPRRDFSRMDVYGRRNDVLFAWYNVPWPFLPVHLVVTSLKGLLFGLRTGRLPDMARGLIKGYWACLQQWHERRAVSVAVYRQNRNLKKKASLVLREIESKLPEVYCPSLKTAAGLACGPSEAALASQHCP